MTTRTRSTDTRMVSDGNLSREVQSGYPVYWVGDIDERRIWPPGRDLSGAFGDVGSTNAFVLPESALGRTESATADLLLEDLLREVQLAARFEDYVAAASDERFSDGMESLFAKRIHVSVLKYGPVAVAAWERAIMKCQNRNETGEELMRQLGLLRDTRSHAIRLSVLVAALKNPDARVRDAACIGLSLLEDPSALPELSAACDLETESWVRDGIEMVIGELEEAPACVTYG